MPCCVTVRTRSAPREYGYSKRRRETQDASGARPDSSLPEVGWSTAQQIDNDSQLGGGWWHDVMNDSTYARLMDLATRGHWHGMMIAISCSTYSPTRFFDASKGDPAPFQIAHPRAHVSLAPSHSLA